MRNIDFIFYIGTTYQPELLTPLKETVQKQRPAFCWINDNLNSLDADVLKNLGLSYEKLDQSLQYQIIYKNRELPKLDNTLHHIHITDSYLLKKILIYNNKPGNNAWVDHEPESVSIRIRRIA